MKDNKKKLEEKKGLLSFSSSILAIIAGLIFGFIVLIISNSEQAVNGFGMILKGGFEDGIVGISRLIYFATPIIMTGLSVGFAFKTGLFNIGASGQFIIGSFVAVYIGVKWTFLPGSIHWIVALIGAFIGGALWGALPGIFKALANVNEVISSIMTNYIAMFLVNILVTRNVYDKLKNQSIEVAKSAVIPKIGLEKIFEGSTINLGIIIAIIAVIVIYIILEKTVFGYELKACGQNQDASKYAGINAKRNTVLSMFIAGGLSGLGGGLMYLYGAGKYIQVLDIIAPEGFTGISVALFGQSNPIGIFFAGLFIAHLKVGGTNLQLFGYAPEFIDIMISSVIYFGAFSLLFKESIIKIAKKIRKGNK
ncbi:MAG: ABC transporter permease [Eubacteriales bacterium]|nr:ABC transporter permease [Eubacteriales bacterium]